MFATYLKANTDVVMHFSFAQEDPELWNST